MEYAKILQKSAGKFDYRESPLKTQMKVNELRKTINKDGRANIIKQEPYANKISTYLSNEELSRKMNEGAMSYKRGIQSAYDDYQLEKLKNDPLKYVEKARKQAELMKLFNNQSQMEYLRKTDPIGLFYLEQSQDEEKQKDLLEQQQKREQQQQEARENAAAAEAQRVKIAREQEEARQEGIRQAVVGPSLEELGQYFKGPRNVKVNEQGNLTINGKNVAIPIAVAQLQKFAPELSDTMGAREIASRYRDSQIRQASERAGISLPQFKAELNRRKDAERMQRFLVTKEQEEEPMDVGTLFDDEEPIVQQHAQELMDENPDLDDIEADRQARENVVEAREIAPELLPPPPPEFLREPILPIKPNYPPPIPPPFPSTWEAEKMSDVEYKQYVKDLGLPNIPEMPPNKTLDLMTFRPTLESIAIKYNIPYNDTDNVDEIRSKIKQFKKQQKKKIKSSLPQPLPPPMTEDDALTMTLPELKRFVKERYFYDIKERTKENILDELKEVNLVVPAATTQEEQRQPEIEEKKVGKTEVELQAERMFEQFKRDEENAIRNITKEDIEELERLKEMGYESEEYADGDPDTFAKVNRNTKRRTLRRMLNGQFGADFVKNYVDGKAAAAAAAAPSAAPKSASEMRQLAISKGVKGIRQGDNIKTVLSKAKKQNIELGISKGSGFRSLSSYPPHIIAGALHIVKQRKKLRTNQNEYNREQARNLLNKILKK
jgi:hypothetical protein